MVFRISQKKNHPRKYSREKTGVAARGEGWQGVGEESKLSLKISVHHPTQHVTTPPPT